MMNKRNYIFIITSLFLMILVPAIGQKEFYEQEEPPIEKPFLLYSLVAVLGVAIFLYARYKMGGADARKKIKKADKAAIRDIMDGEETKVVGKVLPVEKPLIAPFSGKECVYFHLIIEKEPSKEKKEESFGMEKVIDDIQCCDFMIADETGQAKIQASNRANISLKKDTKKFVHTFNKDDDQVSEVLIRYGLKEQNEDGTKNIYYIREGVLEIGEGVAIVGTAKRMNDELVFTHSEDAPIHLSDSPKTF